MSVTTGDLADYVGAAATDDYLSDCLAVASTLVTDYVTGDGNEIAAPDEVVDRAILEVASELFHRKNAPNGVAQFATMDSAPIRIARNPMVGAYPILAPYMAGGFA